MKPHALLVVTLCCFLGNGYGQAAEAKFSMGLYEFKLIHRPRLAHLDKSVADAEEKREVQAMNLNHPVKEKNEVKGYGRMTGNGIADVFYAKSWTIRETTQFFSENHTLKEVEAKMASFSTSSRSVYLSKEWKVCLVEDSKLVPAIVTVYFGGHELGKVDDAPLLAAFIWVGKPKDAATPAAD